MTMKYTDATECYAVPGQNHIIDVIRPDGLTFYFGKTLEDVQRDDPGAIRMTIGEFCRDKAARQHTPITWHDTNESTYDDMLCCLPPIEHVADGFLVGEPYDHDAETGQPRYRAYRIAQGYKVSNRPMTVDEFRREIDGTPSGGV